MLVEGGVAPESMSGGWTAEGVRVDCGNHSNLCQNIQGTKPPPAKNRIYLRFLG